MVASWISNLLSKCKKIFSQSSDLIDDGKEFLEKWKKTLATVKKKNKTQADKKKLLKDWKELLADGKELYEKWKKTLQKVKKSEWKKSTSVSKTVKKTTKSTTKKKN